MISQCLRISCVSFQAPHLLLLLTPFSNNKTKTINTQLSHTHTFVCCVCFCAGRRWTENFSIMHHPSINESFSSYSSYDLHHLFFIIRFIHNLCLIPSLFLYFPFRYVYCNIPRPPSSTLTYKLKLFKKIVLFLS